MLQKIRNFILTHQLPLPPARLIVALSGGGDSVALLLLLQKLGYPIVAAHCNFHLRGEESNRDEDFVKRLCEQRGIPFEIRHFDTSVFAREKGVSIEMAARQLRYDWFEQLREEQKAVAIAVAHHADDNAETLLLNLVRGSGIHGLRGMLPRNGAIIRPLLGVRRKDLEDFLRREKQDFVTDSTNGMTIYKRNKIRHEVLPLLREINPAVDTKLAETAMRLAEVEQLYQLAVDHLTPTMTKELPDGIEIDLQALRTQPATATLLHELLSPYGFSTAEIACIEEQLKRPTGKCFSSPTHLAVFHRGKLEVRMLPVEQEPLALRKEGTYTLADGKRLTLRRKTRETLLEIPKLQLHVAVDADKIAGTLTLRRVQTGDRFTPFGMRGTKLVSDFLTDRHRSIVDKRKALAVCDEIGIVWLVGERTDQRTAIDESTKLVIELSVEEAF